jgi:hypothetical protein
MVSGRYLSPDMPLWWIQVMPLLDAGTSPKGYAGVAAANAGLSLAVAAAPTSVLIKFRREGKS